MNTGDRIKKLRKTLDLTQQKFGERLGVKGNTIAQYELGRSNPVDSVFSLICREFNVNEEWLRIGEGEMFRQDPASELDALEIKYGLSDGSRILIEELIALKPEERKAVIRFIKKVASGLDAWEADDGAMEPSDDDWKDKTVEELEAEYKKSRLNYVRKTGSSVSSTTGEKEKGA